VRVREGTYVQASPLALSGEIIDRHEDVRRRLSKATGAKVSTVKVLRESLVRGLAAREQAQAGVRTPSRPFPHADAAWAWLRIGSGRSHVAMRARPVRCAAVVAARLSEGKIIRRSSSRKPCVNSAGAPSKAPVPIGAAPRVAISGTLAPYIIRVSATPA